MQRFREVAGSSALLSQTALRGSAAAAPGSAGSAGGSPWLSFGRHRPQRLAPITARSASSQGQLASLSAAEPGVAASTPTEGSGALPGIRFAGVTTTVTAGASAAALARAGAGAAALGRARQARAGMRSAAQSQYDPTGFDGPVADGDGWYSFDANPRAAQLRAVAPFVVTADDALRMIRMNNWPMGSLTHSRPYFTPASRFDLASESDPARESFGAIDGKAASLMLASNGQTLAVAGPSRGEGWRQADIAAAAKIGSTAAQVAVDAAGAAGAGSSSTASGSGGVVGGRSLLPAFDWRRWDKAGVCGGLPSAAEPSSESSEVALPKGDGAGSRECSCGPDWAVALHALPCCVGCEQVRAPLGAVPRSVLLGGR